MSHKHPVACGLLATIAIIALTPSATAAQRWVTHGPHGGFITSLLPSEHPGGGVYATVLGHGVFHLESGAEAWTSLNAELEQLSAFSMAQSPTDPDVLVVGTLNGVYATLDGGATWECRSGGLSVGRISSLAFDPLDSRTIYSGGIWQGDWHVYKTTDGGITWTPAWAGIPVGLKITAVIVDSDNPEVVYAATEDCYGYVVDEAGVYKSTDGGATWNPTGVALQNKRVTALASDPGSSQTLYAGVYSYGAGPDGGVFISHDAGATWTRMSDGLPDDLSVGQIAAAPGAGDGGSILYAAVTYADRISPRPPDPWEAQLYKSVDGGQNWQRCADGITYPNMMAVAVDPTDADVVYAGSDSGGVFRSDDAGAQWTHFSVGLERLAIRDIAVHPRDPDNLYVAAQCREAEHSRTDAGVFASFDGGLSWTSCSQGIHFSGGFWTQAVAVAPPVDGGDAAGTVYVGHCGWNGYRSTDQGASWTWCGGSGGIGGYWSTDVAVDPVNPWVVYMSGAGFEPSMPNVYKSEDCGQTWRSVAGNLVWAEFMSLAIDPTDTQTIYAGSGWEGVWKTTDGGETWAHTGAEIDGPRVGALVVDPVNPQTVYAADCAYGGTGVYVSDDGGDRWRQCNSGLTNLQVWDLALDSPADDVATLYAGTSGDGVFRRVGDGDWMPINEGLEDLTVDALTLGPATMPDGSGRTLYAGTCGGVFRRVTAGDLDGDGDVDLADRAQLLSEYGTASGAQYTDGDLDGDGDVDLADLAALLAVYGTGSR